MWWGIHEDDLLKSLDKVLVRLEDAGLFAAAHKSLFFDIEISWCGKVYTGEKISHDREHLTRLASMRRPQTAGELMQFLQAVNWLADVSSSAGRGVQAPSSAVGEHMGGIPPRTK